MVKIGCDLEHPSRFEPGAKETVEVLDIVFQRFSTSPFSVTAFFPALKRFLPTSDSDKGIFQLYDFMRKQIQEHEASRDENAPARDFMDVYLAKIRYIPRLLSTNRRLFHEAK